MESHIGIRFCAYAHTIRVGFYQRMNCFSANYFASARHMGCKLMKVNASLPVRQALVTIAIGKEAKEEIFFHPLVIYISTGNNNFNIVSLKVSMKYPSKPNDHSPKKILLH